jgi:N-terminal acetyltransferase B complex non-catalytic subunit
LLSPARAIQSAEELLLLTKIYESQGRYDEIVALLNSENLGINSRIVQSDWSFVTTKLDALERVGNWQEALSFAQELLHLADDVPDGTGGMNNREKDDWKVWNLLLTAARQLDDAK